MCVDDRQAVRPERPTLRRQRPRQRLSRCRLRADARVPRPLQVRAQGDRLARPRHDAVADRGRPRGLRPRGCSRGRGACSMGGRERAPPVGGSEGRARRALLRGLLHSRSGHGCTCMYCVLSGIHGFRDSEDSEDSENVRLPLPVTSVRSHGTPMPHWTRRKNGALTQSQFTELLTAHDCALSPRCPLAP